MKKIVLSFFLFCILWVSQSFAISERLILDINANSGAHDKTGIHNPVFVGMTWITWSSPQKFFNFSSTWYIDTWTWFVLPKDFRIEMQFTNIWSNTYTILNSTIWTDYTPRWLMYHSASPRWYRFLLPWISDNQIYVDSNTNNLQSLIITNSWSNSKLEFWALNNFTRYLTWTNIQEYTRLAFGNSSNPNQLWITPVISYIRIYDLSPLQCTTKSVLKDVNIPSRYAEWTNKQVLTLGDDLGFYSEHNFTYSTWSFNQVILFEWNSTTDNQDIIDAMEVFQTEYTYYWDEMKVSVNREWALNSVSGIRVEWEWKKTLIVQWYDENENLVFSKSLPYNTDVYFETPVNIATIIFPESSWFSKYKIKDIQPFTIEKFNQYWQYCYDEENDIVYFNDEETDLTWDNVQNWDYTIPPSEISDSESICWNSFSFSPSCIISTITNKITSIFSPYLEFISVTVPITYTANTFKVPIPSINSNFQFAYSTQTTSLPNITDTLNASVIEINDTWSKFLAFLLATMYIVFRITVLAIVFFLLIWLWKVAKFISHAVTGINFDFWNLRWNVLTLSPVLVLLFISVWVLLLLFTTLLPIIPFISHVTTIWTILFSFLAHTINNYWFFALIVNWFFGGILVSASAYIALYFLSNFWKLN